MITPVYMPPKKIVVQLPAFFYLMLTSVCENTSGGLIKASSNCADRSPLRNPLHMKGGVSAGRRS